MSVDYVKMLKKSGKLQIHTDLDMLDLYCEYLLNYDNKTINFSNPVCAGMDEVHYTGRHFGCLKMFQGAGKRSCVRGWCQ